jgi:hypothetical protein
MSTITCTKTRRHRRYLSISTTFTKTTTTTTTTATGVWRCRVVDKATRCRLEGSGFESLGGRNFPNTPWVALRTSTLFPGVKRPERVAYLPPLPTGRGVAWVQLQLYSLYMSPAVCYGVTITIHHHHKHSIPHYITTSQTQYTSLYHHHHKHSIPHYITTITNTVYLTISSPSQTQYTSLYHHHHKHSIPHYITITNAVYLTISPSPLPPIPTDTRSKSRVRPLASFDCGWSGWWSVVCWQAVGLITRPEESYGVRCWCVCVWLWRLDSQVIQAHLELSRHIIIIIIISCILKDIIAVWLIDTVF